METGNDSGIGALVPAPLKTKIERLKDSKGRFISKRDKTSSAKTEQETRDFLHSKEPGSKKKRLEEMNAELFELVKLGKSDAKYATASVNAAKLLYERAYGRAAENEKDADRHTKFPITMVYIAIPEIMHPEPVEPYDQRKKPTEPIFADAEVISTNP